MVISILFTVLTIQILLAIFGPKAFSISGVQDQLFNESKVSLIPL
jgi:hypothetical protein